MGFFVSCFYLIKIICIMEMNLLNMRWLMTFVSIGGIIGMTFLMLPSVKKARIDRTELQFINKSSEDSVLVYLTVGANKDFVTDVNGIFGIKQSGAQGYFWAKKDSLYKYSYSGKGLSGNFCFGTPPINCPDNVWYNGVNLFEVTINNAGTINNAQETFDISNVAGVNAIGKIKTSGGGDWICGRKIIDTVYNQGIYKNRGKYGVFPFQCDDCIKLANPPFCIDTLNPAIPQLSRICNVSRDAYSSGGNITIYFLGYTK